LSHEHGLTRGTLKTTHGYPPGGVNPFDDIYFTTTNYHNYRTNANFAMSIVRKANSNQQMVASRGAAIGAGLFSPAVARSLGNVLAKIVSSGLKTANTAPSGSKNNRRPNRKRDKPAGQWGGFSAPAPVRPISNSTFVRRMRGTFQGAISTANNSAGQLAAYFPVSYDGGVNGILGWLSNQDKALLNGFTYFRVNSGRLVFSPLMGTGGTGFLGLGYQDGTSVSTPTQISDITSSTVNSFAPTFTTLTLDFKPQNKEPEYFLSSTSSDINHRYPGFIRIFSQNNGANATPLYLIQVTLDLELW